ncbi:hypothetical protein CDAR_598311 [Caerostris darwini]|uniref:Uncharacterized protein n=1 Tax=Caerostris darwini TaxID=1538125 RepID=A0AAV4QNH8_9ARAC|nr:hypothetical protein CDAR_598311 [Caerostris darwini]
MPDWMGCQRARNSIRCSIPVPGGRQKGEDLNEFQTGGTLIGPLEWYIHLYINGICYSVFHIMSSQFGMKEGNLYHQFPSFDRNGTKERQTERDHHRKRPPENKNVTYTGVSAEGSLDALQPEHVVHARDASGIYGNNEKQLP